MEELTIKSINIENEDFSIEEAIDFFKIKIPKEINYHKENPQILLSQSPNQIISITLKDTTHFELNDNESQELMEIVFDEIGLHYEIKKIYVDKPIKSSKKEYTIYIRTKEDFKEDNKKRGKSVKELILIKGFYATSNYGKVAYADIPKHVLNVTPKEIDLRIITKLLGSNDNVTYICFSDLIYRKFTEILNRIEYRSVQIDISDYVEELEKIASSQLFMKICPHQYPSEIIQELGNLRTQNYRGVAKLWTAIEGTVGNIAQNSGCTSNRLVDYLNYLSSKNSRRRLFEETKMIIIACDRNNQAHGRLFRSDTDQRYFAILCMKAIRDIYSNWCFFQSLDMCFSKMASDLNFQIDDMWKMFPNKNKNDTKEIAVNNSEDWNSDNIFTIIFNDKDLNRKKSFKFQIHLIKNSIIPYEMEVLQ